MLFILIFTSTALFAAPPQKLGCKAIGQNNNQLCVFNATGESMKNPSTIIKLYATSSMPYALCSKAKCAIDKKNPKMATCLCHAYTTGWQSASVGPKPFKESKPTIKNNTITHVTSNFSFANTTPKQKASQTACSYSKPMPWANCYGARCKVKEIKGVLRAFCQCPIVKTKSFVSIGPKSKKQCHLKSALIWSAATPSQGSNDMSIMKTMYSTYYPGKVSK